VPVPAFVLAVGWHERWHHDPGHAWLRERLVTSFLAGPGGIDPERMGSLALVYTPV
jgi:hypothetical protein